MLLRTRKQTEGKFPCGDSACNPEKNASVHEIPKRVLDLQQIGLQHNGPRHSLNGNVHKMGHPQVASGKSTKVSQMDSFFLKVHRR